MDNKQLTAVSSLFAMTSKKDKQIQVATFLRQRQSLDLDQKVALSKRRIWDWCEHWNYDVYVSFSGGNDSLCLSHLVRQIYPKCPLVFVDTGNEWSEIRRFAKSQENVIVLRPMRTIKAAGGEATFVFTLS